MLHNNGRNTCKKVTARKSAGNGTPHKRTSIVILEMSIKVALVMSTQVSSYEWAGKRGQSLVMRSPTVPNLIQTGYRSHRRSYIHETSAWCATWDAPVPFGVQGDGGQINFMKFLKKRFSRQKLKGGGLMWFCFWPQGALGLYWLLCYPVDATTKYSLASLRLHQGHATRYFSTAYSHR